MRALEFAAGELVALYIACRALIWAFMKSEAHNRDKDKDQGGSP